MKSLVGAAILSVSIAGCGGADVPANSVATPPAPVPLVEVVRVAQQPLDVQPLDVTLSLPGELSPYQSVAIFPRVTGFVKTISVDRGSRVAAGDLIAVIEAPELVAQRSEAQSKVQSAEAQLAAVRSKADANAGTYQKLKAAAATPGVVAGNDVVVAEKTVEADNGQIAAAQQNVEAARQILNSVREMERYLRITAPFAGIVTERNVHPGALVGPGSGPGAAVPMVRLVENRRLRLVIPVPEAYAAGVTTGMPMSFTVATYPGQTFSGTVARISHSVDVASRTMAVELDVNNGDARLAPGTFAQVSWPVRRSEPSLLVPSGSVTSTTDRTFVVRIRDDRAEWVDVKTGLGSGPLVEVFGDLRPGDTVAVRGTDQIRAGATVQIKEAKS
jgi:membrane fusion protein, multidrug efflux system